MPIAPNEQALASDIMAIKRWSLNKLRLGAGVDADPTEIDEPNEFIIGTILSDNLQISNAPERTTTESASFVKLKEVLLTAAIPACRLKFQLKTAATYAYFAEVRKNGTLEGTAWSGFEATDWITKSEDFSGWAAGDLIQIYAKVESGSTIRIRNMEFYYDWAALIIQDP